jgi:hypothetical protein
MARVARAGDHSDDRTAGRLVRMTQLERLHARIRDLEAALTHQRQLTEQARQRAAVLERQIAVAWRVANRCRT